MAGDFWGALAAFAGPAAAGGVEGYTQAKQYNTALRRDKEKTVFARLMDMLEQKRRAEEFNAERAYETNQLAETGRHNRAMEETDIQQELNRMFLKMNAPMSQTKTVVPRPVAAPVTPRGSVLTANELLNQVNKARDVRVDALESNLRGARDPVTYPGYAGIDTVDVKNQLGYLNTPAWAQSFIDSLRMTYPGMIPGADTTGTMAPSTTQPSMGQPNPYRQRPSGWSLPGLMPQQDPSQPQSQSYVAPRSSLPAGMSKTSEMRTKYELNPRDYEIATSIQGYLQANPNVDIDWDAIQRDNPDADVAYIRKALGR